MARTFAEEKRKKHFFFSFDVITVSTFTHLSSIREEINTYCHILILMRTPILIKRCAVSDNFLR